MKFDYFGETLFFPHEMDRIYTTILGLLDRRTRTVQFQTKVSLVDKFMLDILEETAYPYTSRKYDKNWIDVYGVDSLIWVLPVCG